MPLDIIRNIHATIVAALQRDEIKDLRHLLLSDRRHLARQLNELLADLRGCEVCGAAVEEVFLSFHELLWQDAVGEGSRDVLCGDNRPEKEADDGMEVAAQR